MRFKSIVAAGFCAAIFGIVGVGAASAGEITGSGKPTAGPEHANSICVFSGHNDDPTAPLTLNRMIAPNGPGGQSQSFGQDVKLGLDPHVVNPGSSCGPGTNFDRVK
jgi:hypothetical protein